MTTSDASWSNKLRQIGEIEGPDHYHLPADQTCSFFGEYTGQKGYAHSRTNSIILNLKKSPTTRGTPQWPHKLAAIAGIGKLIGKALKPGAIACSTFIPAPPSKPPTDPLYDDRMLQVGKAIAADVDVRPILETIAPRDPAHKSDRRRDIDALVKGMRINEDQIALRPVAKQLILLDDVVTTGATFVACRRLLQARFPEASIFGLFVARRVPERSTAIEDFGSCDF